MLVSVAVVDTLVDAVDVRVTRLVGLVTGLDVAWAAEEVSERIELKSAPSEASFDLATDVATTISEVTPEMTLVTTADVATSSAVA